MVSSQNNKWMMTFFEDNLLEDVVHPSSANPFFWSPSALNEQPNCSLDSECYRSDKGGQEKPSSRKRVHYESCGRLSSKACKEKMRRGRLNDRFMELSALLDAEKPPKTDKIAILADAVRVLNQLKAEVQQLKASNQQLENGIKELKAEKNEVREEKQKLKAEKERLEQQLKAIPSGYLPHPTTVHTGTNKLSATMPGYPGLGMWQFMPPASVDTSQDHLLRPPVA